MCLLICVLYIDVSCRQNNLIVCDILFKYISEAILRFAYVDRDPFKSIEMIIY